MDEGAGVQEGVRQPRFSRRQKWAGGLSVAASIATILTLLLTLGGSSSSTQQPASYPVNVQSNFLNSCEQSATVAQCSCALSFFEASVPLGRFEQDELLVEQGQVPGDVTAAKFTCGLLRYRIS